MPMFLAIPEPIIFRNLFTKEALKNQDGTIQLITFRDFFLNVLSNDPKFTTTRGGRALYKFEQAYDAAVADHTDVMVIDPDVHALFKAAAENPAHHEPNAMGGQQVVEGFVGYRGLGVMQLLPFVDAIVEATDKRPPEKKVAVTFPVLEEAQS